MIKNTTSNLAPETFAPAIFAEVEVRVLEAEAVKLADSANLPTEATTALSTEEQLLQEIARLWTANKVNRYELGQKLSLLKQQTKHGDWMTKVKDMGIAHRTANSLISYYHEELLKRNATTTDAEIDPEAETSGEGDDDSADETKPHPKKGPYFRPMIALKWGSDEPTWKSAIEVIIAECDGVNNPTEAALFAVVAMADSLKRKRNGECGDIVVVPSLAVVKLPEPEVTGPAVEVAPALKPEQVIEAMPLEVSNVPLKGVTVEIVDEELI